MAKPNGGKGGKGAGSLRRRARRDVRFAQRDTRRGYQNQIRGINNAYEGLDALLQDIPKIPVQAIGDQMNANIGELSGLLGGNGGVPMPEMIPAMLPTAEANAGSNLALQYGAGAHELLANDRSRNAAYNASARREGGIARVNATDNVRQSIMDLLSDRPGLILQRLDELRQQALENKLAKSQMASDKAFSEYLRSQIEGLLKPKGGGRGGSGGGGGGNGGGGGGNGGGSGHVWQTGGGF